MVTFDSSPIYIGIVYGGIALLIFCIFLVWTPYSYFKYERAKDIKLKEIEKEKYRERTIIKMPSSSIQEIKSITMGSNQSLSIKNLSVSKRKRLDSCIISCFCGMKLQKGSPYTIYDDTHYDRVNNCYNCYICDRLFHYENDSYLLFTCPQQIIPLHYNGFIICIYCVWTVYIYQKNIKYYHHFVSIGVIDDDDDDIDDYSMDSYHKRTNHENSNKEEEENVTKIELEIEQQETETKTKRKTKIKNVNYAIMMIKKRRFGFKKWFDEIWSVKHIYVAVLLYIFDTTSDISVTYLWYKRAYSEYVLNIEPEKKDNVNIVGLFLCSIFLLLFYRIVSSIVIYRKNHNKSFIHRWSLALLQLFDLLLFWELYNSHFIATKTENFLLISKMKALFESCPQSILQTFIVVRAGFSKNDSDQYWILMMFSLLSAIISILHRFNLEDSYVFEEKANKKWPPSIAYLGRTCFRMFEILSRLLMFSLISTVLGERFTFIYAGIDIFVNFRLFRKGLISKSWMNILGYMLSVVDLASVPAPHANAHTLCINANNTNKTSNSIKLQYSYSIPGLVKNHTESKKKVSVYDVCYGLIRLIGVLCSMLMGFWIAYVFGCFARYLDHFGFVVIISRLYQHTVLLFIMYLMLVPQNIIGCDEPLCTSDALREEIRSVSNVLIVIAFICTVLSFVCYLFVSKFLKVGVIATERNPWLAVRVGDICDALRIFEENHDYNIKSHKWKRDVFWPKFISSKYSIPAMHDFDDKNLVALYGLLKTEDTNCENWDIPLIKAIAFDAVKIKFHEIFELFFHPKILKENEGISPLLNPYTCIDNNGNYILHEAAKAGSIEILHLLITCGKAKIPVLNKLNETPLHLACRLGDINAIEMLLDAWSLTRIDKNGRYPIHYLVETANKQIVSLMMQHINHLYESQYNENEVWSQMIGSLLLSCAQNSNQNMLEFILNIKSKGILPNINYKSKGFTALHYAVLTRNIDICKILLRQQDINANIVDDDNGMSPLMFAVENRDIDIIKCLLSNKCIDLNVQTLNHGFTALHYAFLNGNYNIDIIQNISQHPSLKILPDIQNKQTPLHLALLSPITYLEEILNALHHKPSKDILNHQSLPYNNTVLHIVTMQNNIGLCQMLLNLGADPFIENIDKHNCFDIARIMQHSEIINVLNVNVNEKEKEKEKKIYNNNNNNNKDIYQKRLEKIQLTNMHINGYDNNDGNIHRKQQIDSLLHIQSIHSLSTDIETSHFIKYFWRAVENNDYEITGILLQHNKMKVDEFVVGSGRFIGQTALHIACTLGHYETLLILMNEGCDINIQALIDGATPLLYATRFNHIKCVTHLLSVPQINVNIAALDETTPFYEAVYLNNIEIIKLLLQNPDLNIKQKTRNKLPIDIINTYDEKLKAMIKDKDINMNNINIAEITIYDEHPFESQVCKYCNFALQEDDISLFYFFWDICVSNNVNNPAFVFLHVLCKEFHFDLLKYLIFYNYNNELQLNWIVKDAPHGMYPIQYLVEWFQYNNKQTDINNDSQWILSYILQRTFGSLMLNKMEHFIWTHFTSTVDWNQCIELPQNTTKTTIKITTKSTLNEKYQLNNKECIFLHHIIISLFGLKQCNWILLNSNLKFKLILDPFVCSDVLNANAYYDGVRRNERTYCFPYQFNHIQDITIYLKAIQSLKFPMDSFNSLCSLILCDDIPLDQLQYLLDILRNLLSLPSIHPFVADLIFIEKMLNKICIEIEEYLMRDGSSLKNEISVFVIEATAIAAVANCYKYPTEISQNILDIIYPLLAHTKSPNIRLMSAKLLYNISLQITINKQEEEEKDEDELKMEYEPSSPSNKLLSKSQQICDEIIKCLNQENDVRVRCICLQTLKLLINCNWNLVMRIKKDIAYDIWKERDYLCCINGGLYSDIMQWFQLQAVSISARQFICDEDINSALIKPVVHLAELQRLNSNNKQLSKALNNNDDDDDDDDYYLYDEFKINIVDEEEGDNKYDDDDDTDDDEEENELLPIMGDMMTTNTTTNNQDTENEKAQLKKIYSEGTNILCDRKENDDDDNKWRTTVLINTTPNAPAPEMAFSKMLSEKTLTQISKTPGESTETVNVKLLKQHPNDLCVDELRPVFGLGHAQKNEKIAFALNPNNDIDNESDDDDDVLMDNKTTLMHNDN